jgi:nicotinamidase-related amidase
MEPELERLVTEHLTASQAMMLEKGYGRPMGFGERPAVIVVDLIRGFTDPRCQLYAPLDAEVEVTRDLLDVARAAHAPVVMSTCSYDEKLVEGGVWSSKIASMEWLVEGSEWVEVDERLGFGGDDALLVKKYASCFFGTDLVSRLQSQRVDTVVITGTTTSGCVRATAVDACSYGFKVIVVEDGVGDRAPLSHRVALFDLDAKYGDVLSSGTVKQYLHQLAVTA